MRVSTAFFYAVVFVAATLTLYLMVELMGLSASSGVRLKDSTELTANQLNDVKGLEKKLAIVEDAIKRNQDLVSSLQARLSYMLKEQVPVAQAKVLSEKKTPSVETVARSQSIKALGTVSVPTIKSLIGSAEVCPVAGWRSSKVDVQVGKWSKNPIPENSVIPALINI